MIPRSRVLRGAQVVEWSTVRDSDFRQRIRYEKGKQRRAVGVRNNLRAATSSGGNHFSRRVPGESADFEPSSASPSTSFHRSGRVRAVVDGSEANVCLHWKQSGDTAGGYCRSHRPVGRPREEGAPLTQHHCPARRQLEGDSIHMASNEGNDSRNRPRCRGGPGTNDPRGPHTGRAWHRHHQFQECPTESRQAG